MLFNTINTRYMTGDNVRDRRCPWTLLQNFLHAYLYVVVFYRCQNYDPYLETSSAKRQYRAEYSKPFGATDLAPFRREVTMRNRSRSKCFVQLVTNETKVCTLHLRGTVLLSHSVYSQLNTNTQTFTRTLVTWRFKEQVFNFN